MSYKFHPFELVNNLQLFLFHSDLTSYHESLYSIISEVLRDNYYYIKVKRYLFWLNRLV